MNTLPHEPHSPEDVDDYSAQLSRLLGTFTETTSRFNLIHGGYQDRYVKDVLRHVPFENFTRFLAVESGLVDLSVYEKLDEAQVPQLHMINETGRTGRKADLVIFGVRNGLKPLVFEAFHARPSSMTYISDEEIFRDLGKMYAKAWKVTGAILLDSSQPNDSPLDHVAISSFEEKQGYLFFCPPYVISPEFQTESPDRAQKLFITSLYQRLEELKSKRYKDIETAQSMNLGLMAAAWTGFQEGAA